MRELLAEKLYELAGYRDSVIESFPSKAWGKISEKAKDTWRLKAVQILTLIKQANYVRLSDDQSMPEIPKHLKDFGGNDSIYEEAQQDMCKDNFRKVESL